MDVSNIESFTLQKDYWYWDFMTDNVAHITSDACKRSSRGTIGTLWFHARDGIVHFFSELSQTSQWIKTS